MEKKNTGIDFVNEVYNTEDFNIFKYRNFYNGGGVGFGDINNDGLIDVYMTANMGANKLYLNKGNLQFEDISQQANIELNDKWSTGVSMLDINNDGLLDIYVCNAGYREGQDQRNALFINNGDLTFSDQAKAYGLDENGYTTHASFFDYDQDGDLDVYLLNNSFIPVNTLNYNNKRNRRAEEWDVAEFLKGGGDKLMKNEGGKFTDVSEEAGIYGSLIGFGLGVSVGDINNDQLPDIYISNDFFERDYLYINQGNGKFNEELEKRIQHISHSSMGSDMQDINNDGYPEIFVTDMLPDDEYRLKTTTTFDNINLRNLKKDKGFYNQFMHNTLQLNQGDGSFSEIGFYSGVAASDWSWGALIFDADKDGLKDLFICNGIYHDVIDQDFIDFFANDIIQKMVLGGDKASVDSIIQKMPSVPLQNKFYKNIGNAKFIDQSDQWGIHNKTFSNGAAYGDLDNDGDLDMIVSNVNQDAQVFENKSGGDFIGLEISYTNENIRGYGTKVFVKSDSMNQSLEVYPARGFQSNMDDRLLFALPTGKYNVIEIHWPNKKKSTIQGLEINQYHKIDYKKQASQKLVNQNKKTSQYFTKNTIPEIPTHQEDEYIDFLYERNIPQQLSKEGPCMASGDFNNDGFLDLYIGAASGFAPTLLKGSANGFKPHQIKYFEKFKAFEDTCAAFFDCDGDGDLDLVVGSGSNNASYIDRAFRDRIYFNHNGNFEINFNALPPISFNTAKLLPIDIDGDGDQDLFAGMRSVPGNYGISPGSFIYLNNGKGQFLDVTQQIVPELSMAGMITDAIWVDVLPNEGKELVLVGEWMAPKILSFTSNKFEIIETNLSKESGWFQSVYATDKDGDGDQDLIFGNIGENFYLKATEENPLFLWINDFDKNGSVEKIITKRIDGEDKIVFVKRDLIDQLPGLKKENIFHAEYAKKSIRDLFPKELLETSTIKKVNNLSSLMAENLGNGNFKVTKLNPAIQMSSVNTINGYDVNRDGLEDLILAGNNTYLLPQFSMIDGCRGKVLLNEPNSINYKVVENEVNGLNIQGVVRAAEILNIQGKDHFIALVNNGKPYLYSIK